MSHAPRSAALDQFRGLAIALMVPANYLEHIAIVPAWLKHAPDIGFTVIDLIAPMFIFAIGLSYPGSARRRWAAEGPRATVEHFARRGLALIGLGSLFSLGEQLSGFNPGGVPWGVLQAIGVSIILCLPALWLPRWARLLAALGLMAVYQWLLETAWLEAVLRAPHAGIQGALSWTAILMLSTSFAELAESPLRQVLLGALLLAVGLGLAPWVPVSKHRMSLSFDLIVSGASALLYLASAAWAERRGAVAALVCWGKNPLALYVAHLVLLGVFLVPSARWWHFEASAPLAVVQGLAYVAVLHAGARYLERRGLFLAL